MVILGYVQVALLLSMIASPLIPLKEAPRTPPTPPYVGLSTFSILSPKFRPLCGRVLRTLSRSKRPMVSVLMGSFGDDYTCVRRYLDRFQRKPHAIEFYISNEVCRRNGSCDPRRDLLSGVRASELHKFIYLNNPARDYRKALNELYKLKVYTTTTLYLSLGLESDYPPETYRSLLSFIRSYWPYEIVYNPTNGRCNSKLGVLCEYHQLDYRRAKDAERFGVNGDGDRLSLDSRDKRRSRVGMQRARAFRRRARREGAEYILQWSDRLQGLEYRPDGRPNYRVKPHTRELEFSRLEAERFGRLLRYE